MSIARHPVAIGLDEFQAESKEIVERAKNDEVVIRILGGFAIFIHSDHCGEGRSLQTNAGRLGEGKPAFTDLDLIGYSKQHGKIRDVLEKKLRLKPDRMINALYGASRLVYYHPTAAFPIDVFFDKLDFSHEVSFGEHKRGRLELDYPTLDLADLMLEKLQVHDINRKDLIDMAALILGHDLSRDDDNDKINAKHISRTLANDWGFWYDATQNLGRVKSLCKQLLEEGRLTHSLLGTLESRIVHLENIIEEEPKTEAWKVRSRVGLSKPWYREVEDL